MQGTDEKERTSAEQAADFGREEWEDASSIDWEDVGRSVELLSSRRRFLLRCFLVGVLLSASIAFLLPVKYSSTVVLMPPDNASISSLSLLLGMGQGDAKGGAMGAGAALGAVGDLLGAKSPGQLYLRVLGTHVVQDRMIHRFDLTAVYKKKLRVETRKALEQATTATEDKKSGVISIDVEDRDAKRAAEMANAYAEELNTLLLEISTSAAGRERDFLAQRLEEAKRNLDASASALSQFASKNATINPDEQSKAMVDAAAQLEGQLIAAQADLRGTQQLYTDSNPRVQQLKARITELQQQIRKLGGTESSLKEQGTSADELYPPIRKLPLLAVPYMDLYRRAKVNEAIYAALVQRFELAKFEEGRDVARVQVLDPADVPEKKSSPHRLIIILGGTFLFLAAGISWVFAQRWWQETDANDPLRRLLEPIVNRMAGIFGSRKTVAAQTGV